MLNEVIEEFVSWYESLIEGALDPFRREMSGDYVERKIGEEAGLAIKNAYMNIEESIFYSLLEEITCELLLNTNKHIASFFLKSPYEYMFMPDFLCYKNEVKSKLISIIYEKDTY